MYTVSGTSQETIIFKNYVHYMLHNSLTGVPVIKYSIMKDKFPNI